MNFVLYYKPTLIASIKKGANAAI